MKTKLTLLLLFNLLLYSSFLVLIPTNSAIEERSSSTNEEDVYPLYPIQSFGGGVSVGLPSSGYYNCIGVGNINGDLFTDFVCGGDDSYVGSSTTGLYYYSSNGAGTWSQNIINQTISYAGIEIADCDGDSNLEVWAGRQESSGGVDGWEWTGSGFTKSGMTQPYTANGVNYLNIANMTGGSGLDMLVASHYGLKYYEGSGTSPLSWTEYSTGLINMYQFTQSAVADLNNDGLLDIVAGQYGNGLFAFTQISGSTPSWLDIRTSLPSAEQTGSIGGVALGDVNKDGNVDIIFGRLMGTGLKILMGNGGGANGSDFKWTYLNNSWSPSATGDFWQMHLSDIDFDGDLDLLAAEGARNLNTGALHLYLGNGSDLPGFNFGWTEVTGKGLPLNNNIPFFGSNFLDFDNDGDKDIVGCSWGNGIMVFQNNITLPDIPVAKAGSDIISYLGESVILDGTNSSDPQDCPGGDTLGTILTYDWNITDQPLGSTLTDSNLSPSDAVAKPSFIPTHEGDYIFSLSVRDSENHWGIVEDFVKITVILNNTRPVADAGNDCEVEIGTLVTLNGSGSFDNEDNFNQLTFDWNVSAGNPVTVVLSDESSANPIFTAPNSMGVYQFTLVVQDSLGFWSNEDIVNITVLLPDNIKPVADAGLDFTSFSNITVTLNGTGSYDVDGNILTWDWNCSSHPNLNIINENSSKPSFIANSSGLYSFSLTILDNRGSWSEEDFVNITIIDQNRRPKAFAGEDFTTDLNLKTVLNGSESYDIDGEILTWEWLCLNDLNLVLENANSPKPSFIPDKTITYVFTLRVMDNLGLWSNIDTVNVTVIDQIINQKPKANAGKNQTVYVNTTVFLTGIGSTDEDGSIISWSWNCTSHSSLSIINMKSVTPSFYVTEIGTYTFSLEVQDDQGAWSDLDFTTIIVLPEVINKNNETKNTPPYIQLSYPKGGETLANTTQITWIANDEDGDALEYTILLLDENGEFKRTLTEKLQSGTLYWYWDTRTEEDGTYMLLIKVSDGIDTSTDSSGPIIINNTFLKEPTTKTEPSSSFNAGLFFGILLVVITIIIILIIFLFLRLNKSQAALIHPPERSLPPLESQEENQIEDTFDQPPLEHTEDSGFLDEFQGESLDNSYGESLEEPLGLENEPSHEHLEVNKPFKEPQSESLDESTDQSPELMNETNVDPDLESTEEQYINDNHFSGSANVESNIEHKPE